MGSDVSPNCSHLCFLLVSSKLLNFKKMNKLLYLQTENEERSEEERGSQTHTTSIMAVPGNAMSTVKSAQCFAVREELTNTVLTLVLDLLLQLLLKLSFL